MMGSCSSCGSALGDAGQFCPACGRQAGPAGGAIGLAVERSRSRRTVTVVFADVVGSTELGERLDPERVRGFVEDWFAVARTIIERHGGTLEKFIGDAVMAVFGVPEAHEDDALRATRAAAELRDHERGPLAIRIGVDTGEVVAGDPASGHGFVTGDAVNTAARLQAAADPGHVLIGAATYRLVRDGVSVLRVDPLVLRGKREPVPAYVLGSVDPAAQAIPRRPGGPMVGRASELADLRAALAEVRLASAPRVVTVVGQAGIGKSRLVHAFVAEVRSGGDGPASQVIRGRCLPYGEGITYWPVRELIRDAARLAPDARPSAAREHIRGVVDGNADGPLIAARLSALAGVGAEIGAPQEVAWAVRRMLEHLAAGRAVVVVVDDIQWAEIALVDLLEHVVEWAPTSPILLVCMARPELFEVHPGWMRGQASARSLRLGPLSGDESGRLVEELLGGLPLAGEGLDRISTAAEGNPLFIEQLLAMLLDDGSVAREEGRWVARGDLEQMAIPPSIAALLAARLDRLGPTERSTLERASVAGKVFSWGAVAEMATDDERPAVGSDLAALVRREMIMPAAADVAGDEAFRFRHLLLRDAAYAGIAKSERARLHQRLVVWLEQRTSGRTGENELIVGYHLEQAYRYRVELGETGPSVDSVAHRAVGYLGPAGESAFVRGDVRTALGLLRRALDLSGPAEPRRLWYAYALGRSHRRVGENAAARAAFQDVRDGLPGNRDQLLDLRMRLYDASEAFDDGSLAPEAVLDIANEGQEVARRLGATSDELFFLQATGPPTLFTSGLVAEIPIYRQLRARARAAGLHRQADEAMLFIANRLPMTPTPVPAGLQECRTMLDEVRDDLRARPIILMSIAAFEAMEDRIEDARASLDHAKRLIEDLGEIRPLLTADWPQFAGWIELLAGEPTRAEPIVRWSCAELERVEDRYHLAGALLQLAKLLTTTERLEEVPGLIEQARLITLTGDVLAAPLVDLALAELYVLQDRPVEAIDLAASVHAKFVAGGDVYGAIDSLMVIARGRRALGDEAGALEVARAAEASAAAREDRATLRRIGAFMAADA